AGVGHAAHARGAEPVQTTARARDVQTMELLCVVGVARDPPGREERAVTAGRALRHRTRIEHVERTHRMPVYLASGAGYGHDLVPTLQQTPHEVRPQKSRGTSYPEFHADSFRTPTDVSRVRGPLCAASPSPEPSP